jgi:hypothetical protein
MHKILKGLRWVKKRDIRVQIRVVQKHDEPGRKTA